MAVFGFFGCLGGCRGSGIVVFAGHEGQDRRPHPVTRSTAGWAIRNRPAAAPDDVYSRRFVQYVQLKHVQHVQHVDDDGGGWESTARTVGDRERRQDRIGGHTR
jgi:hypothetical protein